MTSITIHVDEQLIADVTRIVEEFGFNLSSVMGTFYRQMVHENRMPLNLSYPESNEVSLEAIRETEKNIEQGGTWRSFSSATNCLILHSGLKLPNFWGIDTCPYIKGR